mgnify:CR=1 FL=1
MIDLFFRKFYTLWGSIMLVLPVSVCVAWFVITDGAESAEQARMMFMVPAVCLRTMILHGFCACFSRLCRSFSGCALCEATGAA